MRWFRFRRSGLDAPFATPEETAHRLIGVQAQMPSAAGLAFWNRTAGCSPDELDAARIVRRSLVRFWGQRNTVHVFSAVDWPLLCAALAHKESLVDRRFREAGLLADFRRLVRRIRERLAKGQRLTYADVVCEKLEEGQDRWVVSYVTFMQLVREGVTCHGPDARGKSTFVHREHWLPDLDWSPPDAGEAHAELARRYLAAYGPAEPRDLAFWFGTTLANAKRWLASAGASCEVAVGDRALWCPCADLDQLGTKPPPANAWPVRLLGRFDPLLLAHKDKSALIDEEHYKSVWRPSAHVESVLLVRGRIAGTWRYDRKAAGLHVSVRPFAPLTRAVSRAVEEQASGVARFLGLELTGLELLVRGS